MRIRILVYALIFVAAIFLIWGVYQFNESQGNISTYKGEVDLSSNETSLVSGGELNVRSATAPGSIAVGVYSFSGEKIVALNDEKKWPIASLSKLMTALVAFNEVGARERVIITQEMFERTEGYAGDFKVGEEYSVTDLKTAILLVSNNVAAEALAHNIGREKFLGLMNDYAARMELLDTHFVDPTGLSIGNQSTAKDLLKLVKHIIINEPGIFEISRQPAVFITDLTSGNSRELKNINQFAGATDFIGGKTGTTPEAVGNLISIFRGTKTGERFIIILLGTEDRYNETRSLLNYATTRSN